jgi:hypothetical protein
MPFLGTIVECYKLARKLLWIVANIHVYVR